MDIFVHIIFSIMSWSGIWFQDYPTKKHQRFQAYAFVIIFSVLLILIQVLAIIEQNLYIYYIFGGIWLFLHLFPSSVLVITSRSQIYKKSYFYAILIILLITIILSVITIVVI